VTMLDSLGMAVPSARDSGPAGRSRTDRSRETAGAPDFAMLLAGLTYGAPPAAPRSSDAASRAELDTAGTVEEDGADTLGGRDSRSPQEGSDAVGAAAGLAMAASVADVRQVDRNLERLHPVLRERLERVIQRMNDEFGHEVRVTEAHRSQERQNFLYEQGRSRPGPVVTWTLNSNHTQGRAVDVIIDGSYTKMGGYQRLAQIAAEEGLHTLGAKDPGHLELPRDVPGKGPAGSFASAGSGALEWERTLAGAASVAQQRGGNARGGLARVARVADVAAVARVAQVARPGAPNRPATAPQDLRTHPVSPRPELDPSLLSPPSLLPILGPLTEPLLIAQEASRGPEQGSSALPQAIGAARIAPMDASTASQTNSILAGALSARSEQGASDGQSQEQSNGERGSRQESASPGVGGDSELPRGEGTVARAFSSTPLAEARLPTGSDAVQRTAQILAMKEGAASTPVNHLLLRLDSPGGGEDRIRVDLRNGVVGTTLNLENPQEAQRLTAQAADLRQSLEKQGLDADVVKIRTHSSAADSRPEIRAAIAAAELEASRSGSHSRSGSDSGPSREGWKESQGQAGRDLSDPRHRSRREQQKEKTA
jgi:hypothetical protein